MLKRKMKVKEVVTMADCYLGVVDWNKDYKHVLKVNSGSQFNDVMAHMNTHSRKPIHITDVGIVKITNGAGVLKTDGYYSNFHIYNYILFRNDNNTNYYYAFIDSLEFTAPKTTHIHFTIDVWQMFTGSLSFKNSFVERMHVAKSADTVGRWLAPEPFNFEKKFETNQHISTTDFTPNFMVESVSRPILQSGQGDFEYGGQAIGGNLLNYSPLYGYKVTSPQQIKEILDYFKPDLSQLNTIDHRQDVIGCYLVPHFIFSQLQGGTTWQVPIAGDVTISSQEEVTLNLNELASGYTPKNNKMFTSLGKEYVLYNRNGFKLTLFPELCTESVLVLTFSGRGFDNDNIKLKITNYRTLSNNDFKIPYNGTFPICYNENSGVTKQLNVLKNVISLVTNPTNLIQNTENVINSAFGTSQNSVGDLSGDFLSLTNDYIKLRLVDKSPLYDQCKEMDDYLSAYGYSIQEFITPTITSRSNWNYLQGDINFSCDALENDKQTIKNIFLNGVTVWHNPINMLNYSVSNN